MNILVVGSGCREHAIVLECRQSKFADRIFCAPGNAGIARIAHVVPIEATDIDGLVAFAKAKNIGLTIVGPEKPLMAGIADRFEDEGLLIFGPTKEAALCTEGSKVLFKNMILIPHGIPTASFAIFSDANAAKKYIQELGASCVIKADGLADGKGVVVARTLAQAMDGVDRISGTTAGSNFLVEECLSGWECSFTVMVGENGRIVSFIPVQDYKEAYPGGPMTGGMGCRTLPEFTDDLWDAIMYRIVAPTIDALRYEGIPYKGVLYFGLMITNGGPKVLEVNCRLGDPEAQIILPLLKSDFVEMCLACLLDGDNLKEPESYKEEAVAVVISSREAGQIIYGVEEAKKHAIVFHARTRLNEKGNLVTAGEGRALSVVGLGSTLAESRGRAYDAANVISFDDPDPKKGKQWYRDDIALGK
ncbi:MAG: phosphoribosylamine--glycine ligase [Candidatus Spechtbacteria bacterium]|nr:phosphoribosylamine--glycine ligase [Candidatus Spechtbacteria bacterium]